MFVIGKIENRYIITFFSFVIISFVGFIDYITGSEISFSIFYIVPILLVALYKNTEKTLIALNALFAAAL